MSRNSPIGGGGGFHDLERTSPPPGMLMKTAATGGATYRDDPTGQGGAMVITPNAAAAASSAVGGFTNADGTITYRDDPRLQGYHDFDVEEEGEEGAGDPHSLPHVEEVRMRAMNISGSRSSIPFSHLCCRTGKYGWLCVGLFVVILIVTLSVGIHRSKENDNGNVSGAAPKNDPSVFPYNGFTFVSDREKQIVHYLLDVTSYITLNNTSSPQRRAARWMSEDDQLQYAVPELGNVNVQEENIPFLQRYAVLTLYYSLQGPSWNKRGSGLAFLTPTTHECNWNRPISSTNAGTIPNDDNLQGATANSARTWTTPTFFGVECDQNKVVTAVYLSGVNSNKRSAQLPNELGSLLVNLQMLNVDNNNIYPPIPKTLTSLTILTSLSMAHNTFQHQTLPISFLPLSQLRFVDLSNCGFSGPIPDQSYFPRVKFLFLSQNSLSGPLPPGMASWTNLQTLALDQNQLDGPLQPTLHPMWKLEKVYLEHNYFTGSLDTLFVGVDQQRLEIFDVSDNRLEGSFPSQLLNIPGMQILDLHNNRFTGRLPDPNVPEPSVQYITVKDNQLTGSIPYSWNSMRNLTHLDLSFNRMKGVIPDILTALDKLRFLYLTQYEIQYRDHGTHNLDRKIPSVLSGLTALRELGLHDTGLTGPIPDWMGGLTNLRVLALDNNQLNGTIPTALASLSQLRFLLLEKNVLQGTIPTEFNDMSKLQVLLVELNPGINGTITNSSDALCKRGLDVFISDCGDTIKPQIVCECCTSCCTGSNDPTCTSVEYTVQDAQDDWRKGYNNPIVYQFGETTVTISTNE